MSLALKFKQYAHDHVTRKIMKNTTVKSHWNVDLIPIYLISPQSGCQSHCETIDLLISLVIILPYIYLYIFVYLQETHLTLYDRCAGKCGILLNPCSFFEYKNEDHMLFLGYILTKSFEGNRTFLLARS